MKPPDSWNQVEIELRDELLRLVINDTEVIHSELNKLAKIQGAHAGLTRRAGRIGLQSHTGTVCFRNIMITDLARIRRSTD